MAKKEFILQGFTSRTHGAAVREIFSVPDIERVIISVAFMSESGVEQIERELKSQGSKVTVFAGIRNDITSHQALKKITDCGVNLYTVDTGSRMVLFHPKLYLARGRLEARLVIGSANLTLGGLNNNIEAGVLLEFDLTKTADADLVDQIEKQFQALSAQYPEHIVNISNAKMLLEMLESGRLTDETEVPPPRPSTASQANSSADSTPRIKLKVTALHRALLVAKAKTKKQSATKVKVSPSKGIKAGIKLELLWASKPLTRRDLTIPTGSDTHATGSVNLDKGLLDAAVDHRHYFRDSVFSELTWLARSSTVDEAFAKFHLVLKGISYGEFDLAIRHTTSVTSAAYLQRNAMTRLSWGPMRVYVAHADLIGRTLSLYGDQAASSSFVLEID